MALFFLLCAAAVCGSTLVIKPTRKPQIKFDTTLSPVYFYLSAWCYIGEGVEEGRGWWVGGVVGLFRGPLTDRFPPTAQRPCLPYSSTTAVI